MMQEISEQAQVPASARGQRLDAVAADLFPSYSRAQLQGWIKEGALTVNGGQKKPNAKLIGGEALVLTAQLQDTSVWLPEAIDLNIVFEDDHIMVINKPTDLVVHPAAGNYTGTLLNGLLHHYPAAANLPRAGIVHRLDKDTTGLMVVAKTLAAQNHLVQQLQSRSVSRRYVAVVCGALKGNGTVDAPIGRDPAHRTRMAVLGKHSTVAKEAITHYQVKEAFDHFTLVTLKLETGRTHQIRVHMSHLGFGLVGDATYRGKPLKTSEIRPSLLETVNSFGRQALHARELGLIHPATGKSCSWRAPMPDDLEQLVEQLREEDTWL